MTTTTGEQIVAAAVGWWESHRPSGWTERMHLDNPAVNAATDESKALAEAVAAHIRKGAGDD